MSVDDKIITAIKLARQRLADANVPGFLMMDLETRGSALHGDLKIEWSVQIGDHGARSHSLYAAVSEVLRQHEFKKRNTPLAISYAGEISAEDTGRMALANGEPF